MLEQSFDKGVSTNFDIFFIDQYRAECWLLCPVWDDCDDYLQCRVQTWYGAKELVTRVEMGACVHHFLPVLLVLEYDGDILLVMVQ